MTPGWVLAKASVAGCAHEKNGTPCQDAFFCRLIGGTDWGIAVVADGAGSCPFSHIGAGRTVELAFHHFGKAVTHNEWNTRAALPDAKDWHLAAKSAFHLVYKDLQDFARQEAYELQALSCTVVVVIFTPLGLLIAHVGDGRAGYCDAGGEWKSMMVPFKGEYANETVFVTFCDWTGERADHYMRSSVVAEAVKAFVLLTDGCENACYHTSRYNEQEGRNEPLNKPCAGFLGPMTQLLLDLYRQGRPESEIDLFWEDYLKDGAPALAAENDDKTMILAIKL
jgi:hypothetical protein